MQSCFHLILCSESHLLWLSTPIPTTPTPPFHFCNLFTSGVGEGTIFEKLWVFCAPVSCHDGHASFAPQKYWFCMTRLLDGKIVQIWWELLIVLGVEISAKITFYLLQFYSDSLLLFLLPCRAFSFMPFVATDNYTQSKMTEGDSKWPESTQKAPKETIHLLECAIPAVAAMTNLEISIKASCNGCYLLQS